MSFIPNSFGKRPSLTLDTSQEGFTVASTTAVGTSISEVKRTSTITAPLSPNHLPIYYSNIKTQGRVMIYDQDTFSFKMVHDDHLPYAPESPHSITYYGRKSLLLNEESFDFKLKHMKQQ
ncbi:unnamed protein product [Cylindrotheca closterium]|uniref:Uncharacterized protein n=1 Tax=Cylindrotheca closterium TaxID=2856 RepID=A0AAD2GBN3_9STRA|nr:unnamed protein product [Cylindrotheca closterium]